MTSPNTAAVPKEYFPRIRLDLFPGLRVQVSGGLRTSAGKAALYGIEFYTTGLILQWRRIVETADQTFREMEEAAHVPTPDHRPPFIKEIEGSRRRDLVELDLHFFLICWDKLDKCWSLLNHEEANLEITKIYAPIKTALYSAARARDYLEHLDRRYKKSGLSGGGHAMGSDGSLSFIYQDVSNKDKTYDRQIDLGKAQVEKMREAYKSALRLLGATIPP